MSANFYNSSGIMVGIDVHTYWTALEVPIPAVHLVGAPLWWKIADAKKRLARITSDGEPMCQEGMDLAYVPHAPIPIPPVLPCWPLEAAELAATIFGASSKAVLSVASVTGEGKPLAVCIYSGFGLNVNCHELVSVPTGVVIQLNTVVTEPTFDDFVGAIVGTLIDNAIGALGKKIAGAIAKKFGFAPSDENQQGWEAIVKNRAKQLAKDVVKWVSKEVLKEIKKDANDILHRVVPDLL